MTLRIAFTRDISIASTRLILNALRDTKASGYTLSTQLAKLRQMYHSNVSKDKVDSIMAWLAKQGIKATAFVDGVEWVKEQPIVVPVKEKKARAKKVA
jgi:hypothetical protein